MPENLISSGEEVWHLPEPHHGIMKEIGFGILSKLELRKMKNKKIIIIGGNGFIGGNLGKYLTVRGYEVTSFDIARPDSETKGIKYIEGDFFLEDDLKNAIQGQDVVIHALSTINPGNSNERYMQGYEKDFIQSVKLFSWLAASDQKAIFISSGGTVYGEQNEQPIPETATTYPLNHYGSLKLSLENVIRAFNAQFGGRILIARPSNPYGPGQDYRKGVGFIDAAIKKTLFGETIEIWGDGEVVRDYIFIDDLCAMFEALIEYEGIYDVFNISSGVGTSQNDIIKILKKLGWSPDIVHMDARSVDAKSIVLDNERITNISEFEIMGPEKGLEKYVDYLQNRVVNER
jgi:UDP-glucose 4-epimerase